MLAQTIRALTMVSLLGCALNAGAFFAFSSFVMKGLGYLPPARGIEAMNAINVAAPTGWFVSVLLGTVLSCLALGVTSLMQFDEPGAGYRVLACAFGLVPIVLTGVYHVPRNNALAAVDASTAEAAAYWRDYLANWTAWNHVRTVAPLVAVLLLGLALRKAG